MSEQNVWNNLHLDNFETELNSNLNTMLESKKDDLNRKNLVSILLHLAVQK